MENSVFPHENHPNAGSDGAIPTAAFFHGVSCQPTEGVGSFVSGGEGMEEQDISSFLAACAKQFCPWCGAPVGRNENGRPRKFCSDKCRLEWWGKHRDLIKHKSKELKKCPHCGSLFEPRGKQTYCSRICYLSEVTKR